MAQQRRRRTPTHSEEQQVGQDHESTLKTEGNAEIPESEIEPVPGPRMEDKAALEQFMNEPVDVMINESTDPNADPMPTVFVNGTPQRFFRGRVQTVKRKYVEALARAKQTHVGTREFTNHEGALDVKITRSTGLRFPFSVMADANPNGPAWLKKVLAEA